MPTNTIKRPFGQNCLLKATFATLCVLRIKARTGRKNVGARPKSVMRPEVEKMPDGGSCYTYVSHPVMTLVDAAGVGPEVIESTMSEPCSTADKYQREVKDVFEFVPRLISDDDLT